MRNAQQIISAYLILTVTIIIAEFGGGGEDIMAKAIRICY